MKLKRMFAVIMCAIMVFTIVPLGSFAFAASTGKCGDNLTWTYKDGTLTITGTGSMYDWDYTNGKGIKKEPGWCSSYAKTIKKVVIGNGATSIGNEAFWDCSAIQSVSIPSTVKKIGTRSFSNCSKIKSITIPASVESIGSLVFYGCTSLQKFAVNAGNKKFAAVSNVLLDKSKKTVIQYPVGNTANAYEPPVSVTKINAYALAGAKKLKTVILPQNVSSLGEAAFADCSALKKIVILNKNIKVGKLAFEKCNALTTVCYAGSKTNWSKLSIGSGNGNLKNAKITYNFVFNMANRTTYLSSLTNTLVGPKLEWKEVTGAKGYYVYRRTSGKSWTRIATTTAASYIDKTAKAGTAYIYTAKAYNASSVSKFQDGLTVRYIIAPQVSSISNSVDGPYIKWNKISNATAYQVFRKTGSNGTWAAIATVKETTYRDKTAKSGTTYYYSVKSVNGKSVSSMRAGKAFKFIAAPQLSGIQNAVDAVYLKWNKVAGATAYQVFRKTSSKGTWEKISTIKTLNYKDTKVSDGNTFYYSVKAVIGDATSSMRAGIPIKYIEAPTIKTIENAENGNKIVWNKTASAVDYQVQRRTANGSWETIATVKESEYTDTKVNSGTTYYYSIKAVNGDDISSMRSGVAFVYVTTPEIISIQNAVDAVYFKWNKIAGAKEYQVMKKTEKGDFKEIATVTATNFKDTDVKNSKTYYYVIKAIGSGTTSVISKEVEIVYVAAPQVSEIQNSVDSLEIKWNKVDDATAYQVQRKLKNGTWEIIGTTTATSYVDAKVQTGVTYYYSVKALNDDSISSMRTGKEFTYIAAPKISEIKNELDAVSLKWNAITNAGSYQVLRKTEKGSWETLTTTNETSYKDTKVENGAVYYYSVKAVNGDNVSALRTGDAFTYIAAPQVSSAQNAVDAVEIKWNAVANATSYQVQRKTQGGAWEAIGTTTETTFKDSKVQNGGTYSYSVKALKGTEISSMRAGTEVTYIEAPTVLSLENVVDAVEIKWNTVAIATSYQVLRKTEKGAWETLATVTQTNYKDTKAQSGVVYYYSVKAKNGNNISAARTDASVTCLAAPKISDIQNSVDAVYLLWNKVSGASEYQVLRKTDTTNWEVITTTTSASYKDTKAKSSVTYYYAVKAVKGKVTSAIRSSAAFTYLGAPEVSSAVNAAGGPDIVWSKVDGAKEYQVLRKTGKEDWTVIGKATETTYKDATAKDGVTYQYTVRAVNGSVSSAIRSGRSLKCVYIAPVVQVSSITLNPKSISLVVGGSTTIKVTVLPTDATDKTLEWSTSNSSVATVSSDGKITAVAKGTATITCRAADGSNKVAKCTVTVS